MKAYDTAYEKKYKARKQKAKEFHERISRGVLLEQSKFVNFDIALFRGEEKKKISEME